MKKTFEAKTAVRFGANIGWQDFGFFSIWLMFEPLVFSVVFNENIDQKWVKVPGFPRVLKNPHFSSFLTLLLKSTHFS